MKKLFIYLGYEFGLMLLVYYGLDYQKALHIEAGRNYDPFPLMQFNCGFSLLVGMYLALPGFMRRMVRKGRLGVNWLRS
ncbi:hypothetical protein Desor_1947 [Desulfosporosinus orientis DSM 765]|uniref:Uncharacterized protein n=1 Tax=Desulfosporosinus orientis (strain ATCC 19365 / DSM 765 / NCIMB 8382 / VKM B-1628 / Singapore I) TaxID=768706 RepID=G7WD81_DESOD|nr:hypothetical protein [Desulfosporosinus orientis]AET67566.1 hypothetical protein Desor_1947 [Desulfosporosinus orientis DSM 765]